MGKEKKAVLMMKDSPQAKAFEDEFDELMATAKQEQKFFDKRLKDMNHKLNERKQDIWKRFETYLSENKLLPTDYNSETDNLYVDHGVCFIEYQGRASAQGELPGGFADFMRGFFDPK